MKVRTLLMLAAVGGYLVWRRHQRAKNPLELANRVVIITGASSGIGRAAAHAFAAQGARVVLVARREAVLREVQEEIAIYGGASLVVPTDITDEDALQSLVRIVLDAYGRIDVLINNAGMGTGGLLTDLDPVRMRDMINVNLYGPLRLTQLVLPVMLRQEPEASGFRGHIVNVSSVAGTIAAPGIVPYTATRRGLINFSAALRREMNGTGVRVSCVCPTWTHTPLTAGVGEAALRAAGGLFPGEHFDVPEVPAMALVDAVRHNRRATVLGGWQMILGRLSDDLMPEAADLVWRTVVNVPRYADAMREFGG